jgi:hypothetical protein
MVDLLKLIRKEKPKPKRPEPNFTPAPLDPTNHPD